MMRFLLGVIVVFGCVIGGFSIHGNILVLWQPIEVLIIFGGAIGAFIIGNNAGIVKSSPRVFGWAMKGSPYKDKDYIELLQFLFELFKLMRNKGLLQIESHIENPKESDLFNKYPSFANNKQAVSFFCDNIRLMTLGVENKYLLDEAMEKEIENTTHEDFSMAKALQTFGESLPALGIVAAVLGVIVTMGSISEPPEILGHLIGAALVGTFLGILLAYGVFSPLGHFAEHYVEEKKAFLECIRTGIISYLQGSAPTICIELVRKQVPHHYQPSFNEFDKIING